MENVYESCPSFENGTFLMRQTVRQDAEGLLAVYSDTEAVPFFNSDNCHGDDFHYTTLARMKEALDFWEESYSKGYFVRWTIIEKQTNRIAGTLESFHRDAQDHFTDCALIRLDLASSFEKSQCISEILSLITDRFPALFGCSKLVTKGFPGSPERLRALESLGFRKSSELLVGHYDKYPDYWEK